MAQKKQETALTGLSDKEVLISREKYGNNLLTPPKRPSMWKLYLEKVPRPGYTYSFSRSILFLSDCHY